MNTETFNNIWNKLEYVGQHKKEFPWLVNKVEDLKPNVIVEIGVDKGGTLKFWEELIDDNGLVVGIDLKDMISWDYKNSNKQIEFIEGDSTKTETADKLKQILNGKEIDFLYADADKTKVRIDFENYSQFVRVGGIIGFHDIKIGRFPKGCVYEGEMQEAEKFFNDLIGHKESMEKNIGTGIWYKESIR